MPQETGRRTRFTPRAILLNALESATLAGGDDELIGDMWSHATLVARIARAIAPAADVDPVDAAAAGLLHDVGELLLLARRPIGYLSVTACHLTHGEQLAAEKSIFGIDHALLGAEHLLDLRVPDVVADAVADHHEPFRDSPLSTLVVACADEIAAGDAGRRHALDLLGIRPDAAREVLRVAMGDPSSTRLPSDRGVA